MTSTLTDAKPEIRVEDTDPAQPENGSTALSSVANPRRVRWNSAR